MRKLLLVAALLASTSVAHAGDVFSFEINGQRVRIERPRNCTSLSCINVSAPGLSNSNDDDSTLSTPSKAAPAPANQQASVAAPATTPAPSQQPAPAATNTAPDASIPPLPAQTGTASNGAITTLPAPTTDTQNQPAVTAPAPTQAVASANVQAPAQQPVAQPAPQAIANSPLGVWVTEKNEGKVHIVNCGANLCGYAVNAKTGADGEQVLINMKPDDNGWRGRIHDTRGGGTYDSTIAMRGNDKMRVQGCAFGGMFCGGQTWTRVN